MGRHNVGLPPGIQIILSIGAFSARQTPISVTCPIVTETRPDDAQL